MRKDCSAPLHASEIDVCLDVMRMELLNALQKYGDQDDYCLELNTIIGKLEVMLAVKVDNHVYED